MRRSILVIIMFVIFSSRSWAQQEFIHSTGKTNINGFRSKIDQPGLNNNPNAIIFIIPLENQPGVNVSSIYPIAAWYMNNYWYIFNLNQRSLQENLQFKVSYWLQPDENHFVHTATYQNISNGKSILNNDLLNNSPNAQIKVFQSVSNVRGNYFNAGDAELSYNQIEKKWQIANKNLTPILNLNSYNIIIESNPDKTFQVSNNQSTPIVIANWDSLSIARKAGGDLTGSYPNPNVKGLMGRPLASIAPKVGDVLRWDGTQWLPQAFSSSQTFTGNIITQYKNFETGLDIAIVDGERKRMDLLTQTFTLEKPSRVIIDAKLKITKCNNCAPAKGSFYFRVDGKEASESAYNWFETQFIYSSAINGYMLDLPAGTHTIDFWVMRSSSAGGLISGTARFDALPIQSSITIIPFQ